MLSSGMAPIATQEKALDVPRAAYSRPCSSNASGLHGRNSARVGKSARAFKGIICADVSEFESDMPSHAVEFLCAMFAKEGMRMLPSKTQNKLCRRAAGCGP